MIDTIHRNTQNYICTSKLIDIDFRLGTRSKQIHAINEMSAHEMSEIDLIVSNYLVDVCSDMIRGRRCQSYFGTCVCTH